MEKSTKTNLNSFLQNLLGYFFVFMFVIPVVPYLIYKVIISIK